MTEEELKKEAVAEVAPVAPVAEVAPEATGDAPVAPEAEGSIPVIAEANAAAAKLETASAVAEEKIVKLETLQATDALGGKADAGATAEPVEETPAEYAEKVMANDKELEE